MKCASRSIPTLVLILASLFALAGCGGGGGGSGGGGGAPSSSPLADKIAPATFELVALDSIYPTRLTVDWKPTTDDTTAQAAIKYTVHVSTRDGFVPSSATANTQVTGDTTAIAKGLTAQHHLLCACRSKG